MVEVTVTDGVTEDVEVWVIEGVTLGVIVEVAVTDGVIVEVEV
jgi:hypothetical protein